MSRLPTRAALVPGAVRGVRIPPARRALARAPGLLAGLVCALGLVLGAAPALAGPKKTGTIVVNSPVLGATVYVNGEEVGTIPLDPLDVKFGNHVVKVVRKGLIEFEQKVILRPDERLTIDAVPPKPGALLSIPVNDPTAEALLDGRSLGHLPLREVPIVPGSHSVVIRGPDLQPYKESFLAGPHREFVLRPNVKRKDGSSVGLLDLAAGRGSGLELELDLEPAPAKGKGKDATASLDLDLDLAPPPPAKTDPKGKGAQVASLDLDLGFDGPVAPPPPAAGKDGRPADTKVAAVVTPPKGVDPKVDPKRAPDVKPPEPKKTETLVAQTPPPAFVADPIAAEEAQVEDGPPVYTQPWFWGTAAGVVAVGVAVPFLTGMTGGYREVRDPTKVCPACVTAGTVLNQ